MKLVEAEAKNQQSKSEKMVVKRTAEVWFWPPADNGGKAKATATTTQHAMAMW
jgi:hypothetical protein